MRLKARFRSFRKAMKRTIRRALLAPLVVGLMASCDANLSGPSGLDDLRLPNTVIDGGCDGGPILACNEDETITFVNSPGENKVCFETGFAVTMVWIDEGVPRVEPRFYEGMGTVFLRNKDVEYIPEDDGTVTILVDHGPNTYSLVLLHWTATGLQQSGSTVPLDERKVDVVLGSTCGE